MRFLHHSMLLVVVAFLISCAQDSKKSEDNNTCSNNVVHEYNMMSIKCSYLLSQSDLEECESALIAFDTKYPNLNCKAIDSETNEEVTISSAEIQGYLAQIQAQTN